jgi:hypothetical protein
MLKRNSDGALFLGFETAKDIFDAASNIGDLRTEKGKKGAILFLTRCACTVDTREERGYDFSFDTTLPNGLSGTLNGKFPKEVWETIEAAFEEYKEVNNVPKYDYYFDENGKRHEWRDQADSLIGNALYNLSNALYYGDPKRYFYEIYEYKTCGFESTDIISEKDVLVLAASCREYINDKKNLKVRTK